MLIFHESSLKNVKNKIKSIKFLSLLLPCCVPAVLLIQECSCAYLGSVESMETIGFLQKDLQWETRVSVSAPECTKKYDSTSVA